MNNLTNLTLFLTLCLTINLIPGPISLFIMGQSIRGGRNMGLMTVLGISIGDFVHVLVTALGVSAILVSSPTLFMILKWVGVIYLFYLAIQLIINKTEASEKSGDGQQALPLKKIFSQSILLSVLNPHTTLFFLATLPQFIKPESTSTMIPLLMLGIIFLIVAIAVGIFYIGIATSLSSILKQNKTALAVQRFAPCIIYIILGCNILFMS